MSNTDPAIVAQLLRRRAGLGPLAIDVSGSSMGRTIVTGSTVVVVEAPQPAWGEIWAFTDDDGAITVHRCVGLDGHVARFWGDGNRTPDPPRPAGHWIGRVVKITAPGQAPRRVGPFDHFVVAPALWMSRTPRRGIRFVRRRLLAQAPGRRPDTADR